MCVCVEVSFLQQGPEVYLLLLPSPSALDFSKGRGGLPSFVKLISRWESEKCIVWGWKQRKRVLQKHVCVITMTTILSVSNDFTMLHPIKEILFLML